MQNSVRRDANTTLKKLYTQHHSLVLSYNVEMFSVYVLKHSDTNEIYIGKTSNLARRLAEHNASKQRATHRVCGKWILVYAEAYRSEEDASKREKRLKQHGRAKQEIMKRAENSLKD